VVDLLQQVICDRQLDTTAGDDYGRSETSSTHADATRRLTGLPRRAASRLLRAGRVLLTGRDETPSPIWHAETLWEPVKGGTQLDWSRVGDAPHVLELGRAPDVEELRLIQLLGLNAHTGDRPVITQHPELISYRPLVLTHLAQALKAKVLVEIGTARGLQSVFWARSLTARGAAEGRVVTCDIVSHDQPVYRTPISGDRVWTRAELWESIATGKRIRFVHGDSRALAIALMEDADGGMTFDLVYVDGEHTEEAVMRDYANLLPFLTDSSVLIFDDCDPRFPGVERAVNRIVQQRDTTIELIRFAPAAYGVAVVGSPMPLRRLLHRRNTDGLEGTPKARPLRWRHARRELVSQRD